MTKQTHSSQQSESTLSLSPTVHKPTKEEDGTSDSLLFHREYVPPEWSEASLETTGTTLKQDAASNATAPSVIVRCLLMTAYVLATAPMLIKSLLSQQRFNCGSTLEEAKARGCTFDPMTVQWLPPQCSRRGLDEFLVAHGVHQSYETHPTMRRKRAAPEPEVSKRPKKNYDQYPDQNATEIPWRYYTDETQQHEYVNGLVDAPIGHYTYYTTRGEHLAHCAYILVRGAEARAAGERLDALSSDLDHSRHCALFLWEYARHAPHFDTVNTPGDVMLGSC